jgi:hypothetical protein
LADTLAAFNREMPSTGQAQLEAGMRLTQAITEAMRQVAAGVISGMVESTKPKYGASDRRE